MAHHKKSDSPYLYDNATGDIVGIQDPDGSEQLFPNFSQTFTLDPTAGLQIGGAAPNEQQRAAVWNGVGGPGRLIGLQQPSSKVGAKVSFIFDDGIVSARDIVAPMFEARGKRCGFAIPAGDLRPAHERFISLEDCQALQTAGHEIGSQTINDIAMTAAGLVTQAVAEYEIKGSAAWYAERGIDARFFAAASSVLDAGYRSYLNNTYLYAFTNYAGGTYGSAGLQPLEITDPYDLHRTSLYTLWSGTNAVEGLRTLDTIKATIDAAKSDGRWLVFYDHDPSRVWNANSLPADLLAEVLDYCISQGVEILPPSSAFDAANYKSVKQLRRVMAEKAILSVWFTSLTLNASTVTKVPAAATEEKNIAMSSASGKFTASLTGRFLFSIGLNFQDAGQDMTGARAFCSVRLNGSSTDEMRVVCRGVGTHIAMHGVIPVKMEEGDYAEVFAFQEGAGPISSTGGAPGYSSCKVTYLGP